MNIKSEFLNWFEQQHGERPYTSTDDLELIAQIQAGETAATMLREKRKWDIRFNSALYAWQAARHN
jgi:hypothetical protein